MLPPRPGDGDPYRSAPSEPQFVCVVCYKSVSVHPGECRSCGVARLPLSDPEVRAEVRAEAERRLQARAYGEYFWCYLTAFLVTTPLAFFLFGDQVTRFIAWIASAFVMGGANVKLYERLAPKSTTRVFAERRRRLELSEAPNAPKRLPPGPIEGDPEDAELKQVLDLLHVEESGE